MLRDGDYWMDSGPPPTPDEEFWWEVWLRDEGEIALPDGRSVAVETAFREEAASLGYPRQRPAGPISRLRRRPRTTHLSNV